MKTLHNLRLLTLPFLLATLFFYGCFDNSLNLQIRFQDVAGLKQNDQVYFGRNNIGEVKKVTYTSAGNYLVDVKIAPEFKNAATVDSTFYIEPVRDQSTMAVIVEQKQAGGTLLNNGAIIEGSKRVGYFDAIFDSIRQKADEAGLELNKSLDQLQKSLDATSSKLDSSLGSALNDLAQQFNSLQYDIEKLPDSEEVKQLEESLKQFSTEFQKAQKDVQDHIRNEILPQLRQELDYLREEFDKAGRQDELNEIDNQVKQLEMA